MIAQISCSVVALICTNVAGIFTHWPREKAQRKAFIETRQCIEARLRTQRENQQQVRKQNKKSLFLIRVIARKCFVSLLCPFTLIERFPI